MSKFRKKPIVIEAMRVPVQCSATDPNDTFVRFMDGEVDRNGRWSRNWRTGVVSIVTLEGTMKAEIGDWIIRGVKGELYPCKPDIFEKTYESAE